IAFCVRRTKNTASRNNYSKWSPAKILAWEIPGCGSLWPASTTSSRWCRRWRFVKHVEKIIEIGPVLFEALRIRIGQRESFREELVRRIGRCIPGDRANPLIANQLIESFLYIGIVRNHMAQFVGKDPHRSGLYVHMAALILAA